MRGRILVVSLCFALLCVGGYRIAVYRGHRPDRVEYKSYTGDNPTSVKLTFVAPTKDLDSIVESTIPQEFLAGELLALEGALVEPKDPLPGFIVVEFVEHRKSGDVIGNSASGYVPTGDLQTYRILVNVPKSPGQYSLRMKWGGPDTYIARGKVIVRPK